ncbi:MAG: hypothetical protein ABSA30_13915 [Candidatus Aminicenantales bacterium]
MKKMNPGNPSAGVVSPMPVFLASSANIITEIYSLSMLKVELVDDDDPGGSSAAVEIRRPAGAAGTNGIGNWPDRV